MAERKNKADSGDAAKAPTKAPEATAAAPLDAPQPRLETKAEPQVAMAPNATAPHSPLSETGTRLLDEQGQECALQDCLSYPAADEVGEMVTVNRRVYREFTRPGTTTKVSQLLYPAGARITKAEARRLKDEITPPAQEGQPAPAE